MFSIVPGLRNFLRKVSGLSRTAWTGTAGRINPGNDSEDAEDESAAELEIEASVMTDIGRVRENNEDSIVFVRPEAPEQLKAKGCLAVVADGMGGHKGGEVASHLAVTVVPEAYYAHSGRCRDALGAAVESANGEIYRTAQENPEYAGMGTTCTALAIKGGLAFCAHVGDSRLYLVRNGETYQMTEDHSLVMDMVRQGLLSFEEARHHPSRNVITRSVGTNASVEVSAWEQSFPVRDGDLFILCTDGLHEYVEDEELLAFAGREDLAGTCRALIELAKSRGGQDNLSVGLIRIGNAPNPHEDNEITRRESPR